MSSPQPKPIVDDAWVWALAALVAVVMVVVGFSVSHMRAAPLHLSKKLLRGSAFYSLDALSSRRLQRTFGGSQRRSITLAAAQAVTIVGWAVDQQNANSAAAVFVVIDSKDSLAAQFGSARPDVAKAFSNPQFENSGFEAVIPAEDLARGTHAISLDVYAHDGSGRYRDPNILTITVR